MSNDELKAVKFVASEDYSDLQQFLDAEDGITSQKVVQESPIGHLNPLMPRRYLGEGSKSPIGETEPSMEEGVLDEEEEEDWKTNYHEALKEIATLKEAIEALETSLSSSKPVSAPLAPLAPVPPVQVQKPSDKNIVNIKCRAAGINCKGMKAELLGVTDTGSIRNVRYRCQTCKRMFGLGY